MKCNFFLITIFLLLTGCNQFGKNEKSLDLISEQKYKNSGFALVYESNLFKEKKISKKIDNRSLLIFHKTLKKNSFVKITNPTNQKTIIAEVISNDVNFSEFYNSYLMALKLLTFVK